MTWVIGSPGLPANPVITGTLTVGGQILAASGNATAPGYAFSNDLSQGFYRLSASDIGVSLGGVRTFGLNSTGLYLATNSLGLFWGAAADVALVRDAANVLAQRNGTNAQVFRIYRTYTDASNYEGFEIYANGGAGVGFHSIKGASGVDRPVYIGTAGGDWWSITTGGDFAAVANRNIWGGVSALTTTATAGFLGVNSCAGPPTGVPASIPTGQIPMVFDTTNLRLYAYVAGTWRLMQAV